MPTLPVPRACAGQRPAWSPTATRSTPGSPQHAARKTPVWLAVPAPASRRRGGALAARCSRACCRAMAAASRSSRSTFDGSDREARRLSWSAGGDRYPRRARHDSDWPRRHAGRAAATLYTADLAPYLDLLVLPDRRGPGAPPGAGSRRVDPGAQVAVDRHGCRRRCRQGGRARDRQRAARRSAPTSRCTPGAHRTGWPPALRALAPLAALMAATSACSTAPRPDLTLSAGGTRRDRLGPAPPAVRRPHVRHLSRLLGRSVAGAAAAVADAAGRRHAGRPPAQPTAPHCRAPTTAASPKPGLTRAQRAGAWRTDAGQLQRRRRRDVVAQRSDVTRGAPAVGRRDHRPPPAAAARAGRAGPQLHRHGADGAALPADHDRSRATTWPARTATSSRARTSSGRSCRSRSTARSGGRTGRRSRCCRPRRCCRCRCSCASTATTAIGWPAPSGSATTTATSSGSSRSAADRSLYRGTVWIERRTFARVKVQAVQTALAAPVVSNEEIQTYAPVASIGNRPVFLFTGLTARQIMLIAGRNLLVEKSVVFSDFRVNPEDFEGSRDRGAAQRPHHVPRDRSRPALLRQGRATPGRQRSRDAAAPAPWRWASRSIRRTPFRCRSSASTTSTSSSAAPTRSWRSCLPACWRPATSSGRRSARRRSTRASTSSPSRCRRAIGSTTPAASTSRSAC